LPIAQKILTMYVNEDEELELEKNANSWKEISVSS
jgi:hypothetical protein